MNLLELLAQILAQQAEFGRRLDGLIVQGPVEEVDKSGTVRIRAGTEDGQPFLTAATPVSQIAGNLKIHSLPSKGQQMTVINVGGDVGQGLAIPMTWSDANASPSDSLTDTVLSLGEVTVVLSPNAIKATIGGVIYEFTGDGFVQTGGKQRHNDKNVGDTHIHGGVVRGGEKTDPPEE